MEKKAILIFLSVCALCVSCSDGELPAADPQQVPVYDVGYTIGSRADGSGEPEDKDTYTIMSYRVADLNDVATATPHVAQSADQRGYYVYLTSGNAAYVEEDFLVPTRIQNESNKTLVNNYPYKAYYDPVVRDNSYGQRLQAGKYLTAVLHPAVPVLNSANQAMGTWMAVLPRDINCPVYAPMPVPVPMPVPMPEGGLFEMTVKENMAVYPIDAGHTLYITLAKIKAYFYSSPDVDYSIESVELLNVGSSGWFNPYTGLTFPNYNSAERTFSLVNSQGFVPPASWKVSVLKDNVSGTDLGQVTNTVGTYPVHYLMDDEAIFATDYRGQSDGGELYHYVKPIIMRITVCMPIPGSPTGAMQLIPSDVPISLNIERGKLYNFYFDVQSGIFKITYSVYDGEHAGWDQGNSDTDDQPIGETITYGVFNFVGGGDWVPENTTDGSIDIGGGNP